MNLRTNFTHIEPTESLKSKIEEKAMKLNKFFNGRFDINWTCSTEKDQHISHVTVSGAKKTFNATSKKDDLYKTFDDVIGKLEKQIGKTKEMSKDHLHHKHEIDLQENIED